MRHLLAGINPLRTKENPYEIPVFDTEWKDQKKMPPKGGSNRLETL